MTPGLSVGCEDAEDLIADIGQALEAVDKTARDKFDIPEDDYGMADERF